MKNKLGTAAYLSILAAVLAAVACLLYKNVMCTYQPVYYMLIGAAVLGILGFLLAKGLPGLANYIPVCMSFLLFSSAVWGTYLMVNQLGYVVAGLDGLDSIMSYIIFVAITVIAGLFTIIASFLRMAKEA